MDTQAIAARLTADIEREIHEIEAWIGSLGGQQAGLPRLRSLRGAVRALSAHVETLTQQLEAIDKIVGPQGLPELPLVERAVLMRKQMDADDDRCRVWKAEVETLTQQVAELTGTPSSIYSAGLLQRAERAEQENARLTWQTLEVNISSLSLPFNAPSRPSSNGTRRTRR